MRKLFLLLFCLLSLAAAPYSPDRFIVRGHVPAGMETIRDLGRGRTLVRVRKGETVEQSIATARRNGAIYAEPDYDVSIAIIPDDTFYLGSQWEHPVMDTERAWAVTTGSANVLISIIDTGVDNRNIDIAPNWVDGWDYFQNIPPGFETHYHGTHVAGSATARGNNTYGIAGVCWNCSVTSHKFLNGCGSGSTSDGILAIEGALAAGARVMNNSWGGAGYSQALLDTINAACDAGVVFVAAAGNNSRNTDAAPFYPASYLAPCIISVGATDRWDFMSSFSNYGAETVDLLAPGSSIVSLPGPPEGTATQKPHDYQARLLSGTSMASPMVAGAAGLLLSIHPEWTWVEVKDTLLRSVDVIPAAELTASGGRLNIGRAVAGDAPPPPPPPAEFCGDGVCDTEPPLTEDCGSGSRRYRTGDVACPQDCDRVKGRDGCCQSPTDPTCGGSN